MVVVFFAGFGGGFGEGSCGGSVITVGGLSGAISRDDAGVGGVGGQGKFFESRYS